MASASQDLLPIFSRSVNCQSTMVQPCVLAVEEFALAPGRGLGWHPLHHSPQWAFTYSFIKRFTKLSFV